jgi:hypothetical protein
MKENIDQECVDLKYFLPSVKANEGAISKNTNAKTVTHQLSHNKKVGRRYHPPIVTTMYLGVDDPRNVKRDTFGRIS